MWFNGYSSRFIALWLNFLYLHKMTPTEKPYNQKDIAHNEQRAVLNPKGWSDMDFNSLTPEQVEKAKACKSADELVALAKAEGVELTDEQLDQISGGSVWEETKHSEVTCRSCGKKVTWTGVSDTPVMCPYCGYVFTWKK